MNVTCPPLTAQAYPVHYLQINMTILIPRIHMEELKVYIEKTLTLAQLLS
ncbi:hypothetical protein SCFA_1920008 [anaerobic digester metagenome]|uniref:Uncharacterized protein n=1 Tax=anaerobic digester metagenome TaxID=1263854 RepID=A0A485LX68_9ZZZZ